MPKHTRNATKGGQSPQEGGTHDGDHGQMPKDLEGDASCRVPGPTREMKKKCR